MEAQRLGPASSTGTTSPKPIGLAFEQRHNHENLIQIKATGAVGPKVDVHATVDGTGLFSASEA